MKSDSASLSLRAQLHDSLRARSRQLKGAILERVYGISHPGALDDPQYVAGLKEAVSAALDYGLTAIEINGENLPPVPAVLLDQARFAARNGVPLDTVLRRYFAGYTLLRDYLLCALEDGRIDLDDRELQRIWRAEAALFDRLVAAVAAAHTEEIGDSARGTEHRHAERVRRLLVGELLDLADLPYELEAWHLGLVASGPGVQAAVRDLAAALERRLLCVRAEGEAVWAWLGGREKLESGAALKAAASSWPSALALALGEPSPGVEGWRLTHRQAKAALPIALQTDTRAIRYTDVALLASAMRDEVLAESLDETFLAPLRQDPGSGEALCETLRAYFKVGRNLSSAAAALGVSRPTVRNRLRLVEERIGRQLDTCSGEMETALLLRTVSR